jgi:hypothetical protein
LEFNAITVNLPDRKKQSVIFEIQIGVPVPVNGYPQDGRINMKSMALIDTGATGSCISRRFATNAQDKTVFSFRIPPAETHIDFTKEEIK